MPSWLNFRRALYVWWTTWSAAPQVSRCGSMPRMGPLRTTRVPPTFGLLSCAMASRVPSRERPARPRPLATPTCRQALRDSSSRCVCAFRMSPPVASLQSHRPAYTLWWNRRHSSIKTAHFVHHKHDRSYPLSNAPRPCILRRFPEKMFPGSPSPQRGEARWGAVALAVGLWRAAYALVSPLQPVLRHCVGAARFALPPAGGRPGADLWHQEHQVGCSFAEIA